MFAWRNSFSNDTSRIAVQGAPYESRIKCVNFEHDTIMQSYLFMFETNFLQRYQTFSKAGIELRP